MQMFEVGGCIRDALLGVPSKDIDFTVVLDTERFYPDGLNYRGNTPFEVMTLNLRRMGFKIFLETPEYLTVRAQFPTSLDGELEFFGADMARLTADFVLARKESTYTDGRRPDVVKVGTLEDDLARRDFTMNAIARDADGNLTDPHNGVQDIERKIIRAVGDPFERLTEDALRAVRALRFAVTKGFDIEFHLDRVLRTREIAELIETKISDERIQIELSKMFRYDSFASVDILAQYRALTRAIFAGNVSLDATLKTKGRGK